MTDKKLPEYCKNALRYYIGEEKAYPKVPEDAKAYCTINSLFFKGLDSELTRTAEGKQLNPEFLKECVPTLALCSDLMTALRYGGIDKGEEVLYRLSRETDVNAMRRANATVSFTSTSKIPYLKQYAQKIDLILLEFHIPANTPRADMAELLTNYYRSDEQEVLLPPWLPVKFKKAKLSTEELKCLDFNNNPPKAKYIVEVTGGIEYPAYDNNKKLEPVGCESGMLVYGALNKGIAPKNEDVNNYLKWKSQFISMVAILAQGTRLRDILSHEIVECQYITGYHYSPDDLFIKKKCILWIVALLGIDPDSSFADRIGEMSQTRLIHTATTYLLGCHIQENLLLSFDTLPRIFSTRTKGSAFSFFWSMACLCHDMGYMYENEDKYKSRRSDMLFSSSRKSLLNISLDLLSLDNSFYADLGLSQDELKWIKKSITLVKKYNKYRIKQFNLIDHGIAGALIMFDYMMSIAQTKQNDHSMATLRDPQNFTGKNPEFGHANANRGHSRFRACCLMIALTIARHNMYVAKAGTVYEQLYKDYKLYDLIISESDKSKLITMNNPLDQLLYMLDFMDTIDPIKAFYLRVAEDPSTNPDQLESWKKYLLDDISVRCVHRDEAWQNIELLFNNLDRNRVNLISNYIKGASLLGQWLSTNNPVSIGNSVISFSFPVTKRIHKPNPYNIEDEEIMDLCLYEGCSDSVRPGLFYQLPQAYQTFNLLMMDGLVGERVRIGEEKQSPNGIYIYNWQRTLKVFRNVFSAMCKYYLNLGENYRIILYRVDRKVNTDMMNSHSRTIAFTSTSKADFLENFAKGKKNLTYMECRLSKIVPVADFEAILGDDYVYSDEAEILLPPWLSIKEMEIKEEMEHPYENKETITIYSVLFEDMSFCNYSETKEDLQKILNENCAEAAIILDEFRNNPYIAKEAKEKDYPQYILWKNAFRKLVNIELSEIWKVYKARRIL